MRYPDIFDETGAMTPSPHLFFFLTHDTSILAWMFFFGLAVATYTSFHGNLRGTSPMLPRPGRN